MIHSRIRIDPKQCLWDEQTPPAVIQSAVISCLYSGLRSNAVQLLEPIMKYEASVSNTFIGNILSDLTGSRHNVMSQYHRTKSGDMQNRRLWSGMVAFLLIDRIKTSNQQFMH